MMDFHSRLKQLTFIEGGAQSATWAAINAIRKWTLFSGANMGLKILFDQGVEFNSKAFGNAIEDLGWHAEPIEYSSGHMLGKLERANAEAKNQVKKITRYP